jgi:hypothetical protein
MSISSTHIIFLTYFILYYRYIISNFYYLQFTPSLSNPYLLILVSFTGEATSDGGKKNRYASC